MIPNRQVRLVESGGVSQSAEFGISLADSAHIMTILRDTLYTDRIKAILREYSANAWDANRDNGQADRPITVFVPTNLDPTLRIRDYGRGLTQDEVFKVFTQYGASTKRDSDNSVGMLGIGSKSGFAYSDSFTVVSYNGGMKRTYVAVLDKSNKGVINLLHEEPYNGETGLSIEIAARSEDIYDFEEKARSFYRYFTPKPQINLQIPAVNSIFPGLVNGIILDMGDRSSSPDTGFYYRESDEWTAIMGCIPYRINMDQIRTLVNNEAVLAGFKSMSGALYFNIGDVQINASREELKYNDDTKQAIANKFNALTEEYITAALAEINSTSTSEWDKRIKTRNLTRLGITKSLNGELLSSRVDLGLEVAKLPITFQSNNGRKEVVRSIEIDARTRIVLKDDDRHIKGFTTLSKRDIFVRKFKKSTWVEAEQALNDLLAGLKLTGIPQVKTSELPWEKPASDVSVRALNSKHKKKMFKLVDGPFHRRYSAPSANWEACEHAPTSEDIYVILSNFKVDSGFLHSVDQDRKYAELWDIILPPIYGYKSTDSQPVKLSTVVGVNYNTWRQKNLKSMLVSGRKLVEAGMWANVPYYHHYMSHGDSYLRKRYIKFRGLIKSLGKRHAISTHIAKHLNGIKTLKKSGKNLQTLSDFIEMMNSSRGDGIESEVATSWAALLQAYPLLCMEDAPTNLSNLIGDDKEAWLNYIKTVDELKQIKETQS